MHTSSQQSCIAITHSSKSGGHLAWASPIYCSGPPAKMDSRAFKLARDKRDIEWKDSEIVTVQLELINTWLLRVASEWKTIFC